jgi:hypothetical protein
MILATPNIPTTSDSAAIAHPPLFTPLNKSLANLLNESMSFSEKSSAWVGFSFRSDRIAPANSSFNISIGISSLPCTMILGFAHSSGIICLRKPVGIKTQLSIDQADNVGSFSLFESNRISNRVFCCSK